VVPAEFDAYFTAAAAAAGVLIGLLFVAVSLRPETVFGTDALSAGRAQAGAAFIGLADCFFLSIVALIPQAGLGVVAIVTAVTSLSGTVRLHSDVPRNELRLLMLLASLATYLYQLVIGFILEFNPADSNQVSYVAYLEIALFAVALGRAWDLVQGKHLPPPEPPSAASAERPDAPS
jgi:hypothetical protein